MIESGYRDVDFAALLELQARASGLELVSEEAPVDDGLDDTAVPSQPATSGA
jgi:hypothetical protein